MIDINTLLIDSSKVTGGVWFDFEAYALRRELRAISSPDETIACVKVAQWDNAEHAAVVADLYAPYAPLMQHGVVDKDIDTRIAREAATSLVKDWRNMRAGGVVVEFSQETARKWLNMEDFPLFFRFVWAASRTESAYRRAVESAIAGN